MANDEHLAILDRGVQAWNKWALENPLIFPDLMGANFSNANLSRARLDYANLRHTDLSGANLSSAYLRVATISTAILQNTDLTNAGIGETIFADTDLSQAIGLDSMFHDGPSHSIVLDCAIQTVLNQEG